MVEVIRNHYEHLIQQTVDESKVTCWPRGDLVRACQSLQKAEIGELSALRELSIESWDLFQQPLSRGGSGCDLIRREYFASGSG